MIRNLLLGACLAACCLARAEPAPNAAWADGRRAYDAGEFAAAVKSFAVAADAAPRDAAARFNLGNSLYKSGRLGRAIASWERAFALDPRDSSIRFNLAFGLRRAGEDFVPAGTPPALFWAFTILSERELAGLHWLALWIAAILGTAAMSLTASRRRDDLRTLTFGAAVAWLFFALWWVGLRSVLPPDRGVVVTDHAELRHGPGAAFGAAFTVPEGRRVRVLGDAPGWLEVGVLKEGARGWIEAASVERLDAAR